MDLIGNNPATASYDFENPINLAEDEGEDDCEVPGELVLYPKICPPIFFKKIAKSCFKIPQGLHSARAS